MARFSRGGNWGAAAINDHQGGNHDPYDQGFSLAGKTRSIRRMGAWRRRGAIRHLRQDSRRTTWASNRLPRTKYERGPHRGLTLAEIAKPPQMSTVCSWALDAGRRLFRAPRSSQIQEPVCAGQGVDADDHLADPNARRHPAVAPGRTKAGIPGRHHQLSEHRRDGFTSSTLSLRGPTNGSDARVAPPTSCARTIMWANASRHGPSRRARMVS